MFTEALFVCLGVNGHIIMSSRYVTCHFDFVCSSQLIMSTSLMIAPRAIASYGGIFTRGKTIAPGTL
jgi:hypothetical protein